MFLAQFIYSITLPSSLPSIIIYNLIFILHKHFIHSTFRPTVPQRHTSSATDSVQPQPKLSRLVRPVTVCLGHALALRGAGATVLLH